MMQCTLADWRAETVSTLGGLGSNALFGCAGLRRRPVLSGIAQRLLEYSTHGTMAGVRMLVGILEETRRRRRGRRKGVGGVGGDVAPTEPPIQRRLQKTPPPAHLTLTATALSWICTVL